MNTIIPMDKAAETWTASIHFKIDLEKSGRDQLEQMNALFARHPGTCKGVLHFYQAEKAETIFALPDSIRIRPGRSLEREINGLLGYRAVTIECSQVSLPPGSPVNGKEKRYNNHR